MKVTGDRCQDARIAYKIPGSEVPKPWDGAQGSRFFWSIIAGTVDALPDAKIGAIFGLLEQVRDVGGKEDVYKVAQRLRLDLDDLTPVTEAAELLLFVKVEKGNIELTATAVNLLVGDDHHRKKRFREQILKLPVIQQVLATLKSKRKHRMGRETLMAKLGAHFSPGEAERQVATAINWGRYAELLDCDQGKDEIYLRQAKQAPPSAGRAASVARGKRR